MSCDSAAEVDQLVEAAAANGGKADPGQHHPRPGLPDSLRPRVREADEGCPFVKGASLRLSMPYLDPKARTGRVRIELANKDLDLRPGWFSADCATGYAAGR